MECITVNVNVSPQRLYYTVTKEYSLLGRSADIVYDNKIDILSQNSPRETFKLETISRHLQRSIVAR